MQVWGGNSASRVPVARACRASRVRVRRLRVRGGSEQKFQPVQDSNKLYILNPHQHLA